MGSGTNTLVDKSWIVWCGPSTTTAYTGRYSDGSCGPIHDESLFDKRSDRLSCLVFSGNLLVLLGLWLFFCVIHKKTTIITTKKSLYTVSLFFLILWIGHVILLPICRVF